MKVFGWLLLAFVCASPCLVRAGDYYVDSLSGHNDRAGTSPETAWHDFSIVNGRTLEAGDSLLIRRGSVINQELRVGAKGTSNQWVVISAYGEGARPVIRRTWRISERCAVVTDPDCLRVSGLAFSYAGKGLVVHYATRGHTGLVIEDCVAHHIEGIYREWTNCSGIPEWRDAEILRDDGVMASAGIGVSAGGRNITLRDCDLFQNSWGFWIAGEKVTVDRVNVHHSYAFNSSPHPALLGPLNSVMQNCVFDAPGYHAFAGTMGIMLCNPRNLTVRNCTFRNQPDSGSHDEGGIDFENSGDGCLIDACTFENNAGAAIEVLGLSAPQPKNVTIQRSRFIRNNWALKLGPSEIFVWGQGKKDPKVCCSTGVIRDNGYVLAPDVCFFTNQAPASTQWTLQDNTGYASVKELEQALPLNRPPVVEAGDDIMTGQRRVSLAGKVSDDAKPARSLLTVRWEMLEGPGTVTFKNAAEPDTRADFSAPGDYLLRLVGDDGELWTSDLLHVCILPMGITVAKSWEFNKALDKEGWSEAELGTTERSETPVKGQAGKSLPVNYVAGGYYIVAVENSTKARLISADRLDVDIATRKTVCVRMQNSTSAKRMTLAFTAQTAPALKGGNRVTFEVVPNDREEREYFVDFARVAEWTGRLQSLTLELTDGTAVTGTCRIDAIRIGDGW